MVLIVFVGILSHYVHLGTLSGGREMRSGLLFEDHAIHLGRRENVVAATAPCQMASSLILIRVSVVWTDHSLALPIG